MEEIRQALMSGAGNKLTKKSYKFAVEVEKKRLFNQLVFLTLISVVLAMVFFFSLYFDIIHNWENECIDYYDLGYKLTLWKLLGVFL